MKVLPRFELGLLDSKSKVLPLHHRTDSAHSSPLLKLISLGGCRMSNRSIDTYLADFVEEMYDIIKFILLQINLSLLTRSSRGSSY